MRIVLLNDSFPPLIDGVANTVVNYARILTERGNQVLVLVPEYPDAVDDYPFEVLRYKSLDTTRLVGYRTGDPFDPAMIRRVETFKPEILHCHCPMVSGVLARVLRNRLNIPLVFTYHTKFDIEIRKYIAFPPLQKAAIRLLVEGISASDEVWTVSQGAADNLRSMGWEGTPVIMENGVDLPQGRASREKIAMVERLQSLPDSLPVFLFVGRMMWYKGMRLSFDALKLLQDKGFDFRMLLVGDGGERAEMEDYVSSIGLTDKILFCGAVHDRELLRCYYSRADLFLFPSTFDTNGIVVREAAACSLGSLLIKESAAAEGIIDGDTGLLAEENAVSIAEALEPYMKSIEKMHRLGENASQKIYIPWEKSVAVAEERYKMVINYTRNGNLREERFPDRGLLNAFSDFYDFTDKFRRLKIDTRLAGYELRDFLANIHDRYL